MSASLVGIFVGGQARRMGGAPKGLLPSPSGEPLVRRLARIALDALDAPRVVLVGGAGPYLGLGLESLEDDPAGIGPIGGLAALLAHAERSGASCAIALATDLPYLDATLLQRLTAYAPDAAAVAPRPDGIWQPLCARYAPGEALAAARICIRGGNRALHDVLDALGSRASELVLTREEIEQLRDWDTPDDISR
jgi:molybdopterin-guanine dinucleotide biosynthesis protein A